MRGEENRGSWYLLTGIILGAILGVFYARNIQPVRYVDTAPSSLQEGEKDQYRSLIAAAYLSNGDLVRARARLNLLGDDDISRALAEQAQRTLARDGSSSEVRALGLLAVALGQEAPGPILSVTQGSGSPTQIQMLATPAEINEPVQENPASPSIGETPSTDTSSAVPTSSLLISPELQASFVLASKLEICDQQLSEPIIQIEASDQAGQPIPGVIVIVSWVGGEERFYTGLKPEKGLGYADYTLNPDFVYSLRLGENGAPLGDISPVVCSSASGDPFWGALSLKFTLPQ